MSMEWTGFNRDEKNEPPSEFERFCNTCYVLAAWASGLMALVMLADWWLP